MEDYEKSSEQLDEGITAEDAREKERKENLELFKMALEEAVGDKVRAMMKRYEEIAKKYPPKE